MINGAGSTPLSARPSTNSPAVSQCRWSTAPSCKNGTTVYAPPNVSGPAFRPSQKIATFSERVIPPSSAHASPGPGAIAVSVCPELVGETGADEHKREPDTGDQREHERDHGQDCERGVGDERAREAPEGAGDERADRRAESVEELVELLGKSGLDVGHRQGEHEEEAGEHESESGQEAAELAAAQAPEVDADAWACGPART